MHLPRLFKSGIKVEGMTVNVEGAPTDESPVLYGIPYFV